jgi:hypothetical protein
MVLEQRMPAMHDHLEIGPWHLLAWVADAFARELSG